MSSQTDGGREKKRAQFAEGPKAKKKAAPVLIIVLLALVGVVAYLVLSPSAAEITPGVSPSGDVRIPVAELNAKAKFIDHRLSDNSRVRFFALKTADGKYRAALDACDVCFRSKMGYSQEGDQMICNKCGLPFQCAKIGEVAGGCNPIGLPHTVEGDEMVIKAEELEKTKQYF
jgi:uncharacterized membrane protein